MVGRFFLLSLLVLGGALRTSDDATLCAELTAASADEYGAVLDQVYANFDEHGRVHRYEPAIFLAECMYADADRRGEAYVRTRIWAGSTLGLIEARAGRHEAAEETVSHEILLVRAELGRLTSALGNAEAGAEDQRAVRVRREALRQDLVGLHDRRALARIGAGRTAAALGDLGAALAGGSRDAALVLGRLALREGNHDRARQLLGSLLDEDRGEAWARRGWGLTMLP